MIISLLTRILFAAYFLEAGLILIVAPWSSFWERNSFVAAMPSLEPVLVSWFVRGGVTGVGAITALAGLAELGGIFGPRRSRTDTPERNASI